MSKELLSSSGKFIYVTLNSNIRAQAKKCCAVHPEGARLYSLIDGLDVYYRLERSFKISRNSLLGNRFILTLSKKNMGSDADHKMLAICRALSMPEELYEIYGSRIGEARLAHFGFEEGASDSLFKVYLEFPYKRSGDFINQDQTKPWLLLMAFKWEATDNTRRAVTRYTGLPGYTPQEINRKIAGILSEDRFAVHLQAVTAMLDTCEQRNPKAPMWYLDVTEEGNPRKSFDIKTYKAKLKIYDVHAPLTKLYKHYSIAGSQFDPLYNSIKGHKFGHISCGVGRDGEDFISIYHEAGLE